MTREEFRNLEVEETFNVKNKKIIVSLAETDMSCKGCIFNKVGIDCITLQSKGIIPECDVYFRDDHKSVIFAEVEE